MRLILCNGVNHQGAMWGKERRHIFNSYIGVIHGKSRRKHNNDEDRVHACCYKRSKR